MESNYTTLLNDSSALQSFIVESLYEKCGGESLFLGQTYEGVLSSSVMLLLGKKAMGGNGHEEVCFILNKRSSKVRQPGDLCCPGGAVEMQLDPYLAKLLALPGSPLTRWAHWDAFRAARPLDARLVSLQLATGLRECWEEMRLNPFFTSFLGPLPTQRLLIFQRLIHPMVGWVPWQKRFIPSWEVEKIVYIPLRAFLKDYHYARYRLHIQPGLEDRFDWTVRDFPCFLYSSEGRTELLWGVTYRIVTFFMELVFGYSPPAMESLPVVVGMLDRNYLLGHS